jgi:hypothetical protein
MGIGTSDIDSGVYINLPSSIENFKWINLSNIDESTYDPDVAK